MSFKTILFLTVLKTLILNNVISYNVIDVDDILSENLMPGNLLVLENPNGNDTFEDIATTEDILFQGSFEEAFLTMGFHRSKMNEYLCRNFVAEQIVSEMSIPKISRRSSASALSVKEDMMFDEGSKSYKDWLSKSTTLEDIYRHYNTPPNRKDDMQQKDDEEEEEYDTHVTNYVYEKPAKHTTYNLYGTTGYNLGTYPFGGSLYDHGAYQGYHPSNPNGYGAVSVHSYESGHGQQDNSPKYNKDKDLTDLFDIALTALAYLSFGMFIIHVVMCISAVTNNATTVVTVMPMNMGPTAPEPTGEGMTMPGNGMGGDMTMTGNGGDMGMTMTENGGDMGMTMTGNGGDMGMTMTGTGVGMTGTGEGNGGMTGEGNGGMTGEGNGGMTGEGNGGMTGEGNGGMTGEGNGGMTGEENGGMTGEGNGGMTGEGNGGMTGEGNGGMTGEGNGGVTGEGNGGMTGDGNGDMTGEGNGGVTGEGENGMTGNGGNGGMTGNGEGSVTGNGEDGGVTGNDDGGVTGNGDVDEEGRQLKLNHIPRQFKVFEREEKLADKLGKADNGDESVRIKDNLNIRFKREAFSNNHQINELARRVLTSIEAALVAKEDNGVCLRRQLCENNKYSRALNNSGKIWIPVWSLGMSWLSGRLIMNIPPATSMLDGLKASILGLGRANCDAIYKECDLNLQRMKQKARKRRSTIKTV